MTTERQKLLIELRSLAKKEQAYKDALETIQMQKFIVEQKIKACEPGKDSDLVKIGN